MRPTLNFLMFIVCLVVLLLVARTVRADEWDSADKALAATALITALADWRQTQEIVKRPDLYYERNPLLGEHPSMARVNAHFIGSLIAGALIADALPSRWRKTYLGAVTAIEVGMVHNNLRLGIGLKF